MKDTVTLELTRAEAIALDELVSNSAEKFFGVGGGDKDCTLDGWNKETAASACDKLREAAIGKKRPACKTWTYFLTTVINE